ncbi:MAG: DPP IV N-terminal domain-containing protein [Fidelibacterota bacterium]
MRRLLLISVLALLVFNAPLVGQSFGKNKVQYRTFDWSYIQSAHFDLYFYDQNLSLAEFALEIAEQAYEQIARYINWDLRKRISIIIYSSHNDFQQTNITYEYMPEGVGGVTELFKNRIVIPFEGSYEQFRHVIHHELVHGMINDMIYGGSAQSLIANRIQIRIPLWMNEGLAEYLSLKWDTQADMIMRDVAINDKIPDIRELEYYMVYKGGQSVWKFIADTYGWQKIGEIWGRAKQKQNVEEAFEYSVGLDYEDLSKRWKKYLKREYWPDVAGREDLEDYAHLLTDHEELENYFNISPAISPDGGRIAILTDRSGYADVYLISAEDGKVLKKLVKGNRTPDFEELKWLQPGLSWSPDGKKIVFAAKSGKSDALYIIDVNSGKKQKLTFDLEGIFTAAWSPDGEKIAFIGNKTNASDIYIYNLKDKSLKNLTNDIFSDSEPSWSPDGTKIAFISDRPLIHEPPEFKMIVHDYRQTDIYLYDLLSKEIKRVTQTPDNENYPAWSHTTNTLAYTSDRNGVWNLYLHDFETGDSRAISNVLTGIFQLSWSTDDQNLIFSGYTDIGWDIYSLSNPLDMEPVEVKASNFVLKGEETEESEIESSHKHERRKRRGPEESDFSRWIFASEYSQYNDEVDTTSKPGEQPLSISDYKVEDGSYRIHPYKTRFTLDLVNGQASFSNVFGYIGTTLFAFSDILGDHRIFLGTEMVISPENSDYFFQYDYLRQRTDYSMSFFHTANFFGNQYEFLRLRHYALDFSLARPFSRFQRLEVGISTHTINHRLYYLSGYDEYDIEEEMSLRALTYRLNWVYDNSVWGFTGPGDGFRANLQYFQSLNAYGDKMDFKTVLLDARRYFRVSRLYTFAFRLMTGQSFGSDAQKFFLGGVDNWILGVGETNGTRDGTSRFNPDENLFDSGRDDYLKNLYFSIFALPVRGTRYLERSGTKLFLTNFEFRFPFVNYLALGFPLKLIFGNIRGVMFVDAGASWDGNPHLSSVNPNTGRKEFDDLIMDYGIGLRINLGYFILRLDTAWDYKMRGSSRPQYYLSLGTDL